MAYQNAFLLESKTNKISSFSFKKRKKSIKEKAALTLEYVLIGLMLNTYMTLSYLWLFAHKVNLFRKSLLKPQQMLPQHQGFLEHSLSS